MSYRAVLALPHARGLLAASIVPRLCYGLAGIPLLLSLQHGTGSYAVAGTATSLYALCAALLGPARVRLVQRHRRAFGGLTAGYALSLIALAAACYFRLAVPFGIGLAIVAGLCPPPVGPLMRARWSALTDRDPRQRQRALTLDTATESTAFTLGPALGGTLTAIVSAPLALAACGVLGCAGFVALGMVWRKVPSAAGGEEGRGKKELGAFGIKITLLIFTGVAATAASTSEVVVVAAWGARSAGILTALFPVGGVLGGLLYGRRDWPGDPGRRPVLLAAASAACYILPALAYAPTAAGAALLIAGACSDILVITTYQLVSGPGEARAGAWLNTTYNLGVALGSVSGGLLADRAGPRFAFAAVAIMCAVAAASTFSCGTVTRVTGRRSSPASGSSTSSASGSASECP